MIAFMKDVRLTTQIFYQFGALKIYKSKYVIPSPPERNVRTAIQMAIEDFIKKGVYNKTQAKYLAKDHPKFQAFQELNQQERQKYKAQQEEYHKKYRLFYPTKSSVLLEYLYEKYPNKPYKGVLYAKVLDELPPLEKERVQNIVAEIYEKQYTEAQKHNEKFRETYKIPRVLGLRQIFSKKYKLKPVEASKQFANLKPEELQQLEEDRKLQIAETQKKIENLAQMFGLSVQEFKEELTTAQSEFRKAKKQKKSESSDSSSSDKEDKKEEKQEEKK